MIIIIICPKGLFVVVSVRKSCALSYLSQKVLLSHVVSVPKRYSLSYLCQSVTHCRICAKALLIVISVPKRYSLSYLCQSVTHCRICAKALLIVISVPKRYSLSYLCQSVTLCRSCAKALLIVITALAAAVSYRVRRPEFPKRDNELLIEHKNSGIFASVLITVSV